MPLDIALFSPAVASLLKDAPLAPLGPGSPLRERKAELAALNPRTLVAPQPLDDASMAWAAISGLWLRYNFLDESHRISQDLQGTTGSYWHGIMHRREPDFGNAKYWFRQVGAHEVFAPLCEAARVLVAEYPQAQRANFLASQANWDPMGFVDLCQAAAGDPSLEPLCLAIQQAEWELLFDDCYRRAIGE